MKHNGEDPISPNGTQADAVEQVRFVGGEITLEGRELTAAAAAAGLSVRWLDFASSEAQAAIAAQGPGAARLPLVLVGAAHTLQRPAFTAVIACLAGLDSGNSRLPAGAALLGDDRRPTERRRRARELRTSLRTCDQLRRLVA
jgi:hypothetical protein